MKNKSLKLTPSMIIRRGHYAYFFRFWLYGKIVDYHIAGESLNRTIFNSAAGAFPVQCISYPYLNELLPHLKLNPHDVFVDVGCAWGRLLGYLRLKTECQSLVGVELNATAAECAQTIFLGDPRVTIIQGDILEHLPENATVFFLFNPFDKKVLESFIRKIETSIFHPVRLLYLHPMCRGILDAGRTNWVLREEVPLKPKHLGPITLCVYEYIPAN